MVRRRDGDVGLHRADAAPGHRSRTPHRRRPGAIGARPRRHRRCGSPCTPSTAPRCSTCGDRAAGLAELQQARSDFGDNQTSPQHCAAMAMLEFRVALLLGHAAAARTVLGWLTERDTPQTTPSCCRCAPGPRPRRSPRACPHPDPPGAGRLHASTAPAHRGGGLAAGDLDRRRRRRTARRPPRPTNRFGPRRTPRRPPPVRPGRTARPRAARTPARQLRRIRAVRRTACPPRVRVNSGRRRS